MASSKFTPVTTGDRTLDAIQRAIGDFADQLEDPRRGLLATDTMQTGANHQITEELFIEYIGVAGGRVILPAAALRGNGRSMGVFIANASTGNLTVAAVGSEKVAGASTITLATGTGCWLFSNGSKTAGKWYRAA